MSPRTAYRHHAPRFKLQLCQDIRSGVLAPREAQKMYSLSASLIQLWLTLFDRRNSKAAMSRRRLSRHRMIEAFPRDSRLYRRSLLV